MWNVIWFDDFIKLVSNVRNIDFNNVQFSINDNGRKYVKCNIDGILVHFVHSVEDFNCKTPTLYTRDGRNDIICNNIIEQYVSKKYFSRVSRMKIEEQFIFILDTFGKNCLTRHITLDQMKQFYNLKLTNNDKMVILSNNAILSDTVDKLIISSNTSNTYENAKKILENHVFTSWVR